MGTASRAGDGAASTRRPSTSNVTPRGYGRASIKAERRIQQRLEVAADGLLQIPGVEQR